MRYGVLWDLDGTLWDSGVTVAKAWNEYAAAHGVKRHFTPDDCRSYCGRTLEQIAELVFPQAEPQWRNDFIVGCCDAECIPLAREGGDLYDGVPEVLAALHARYFMAVVSNCGLGYIEAFFAGNRTTPFFDDSENAARTGRAKGENIRLVMERNGIQKAVYVGDTMGDAAAAAAAGIPFIHAAYGFGSVPDAKYVARSFRELGELIPRALTDLK